MRVKNKLNESSLAQLYREQGKKLYNLAYRVCGDPDTAQDLLHESFIKIQNSMPDFRQGSSGYTWAYKITLNTCIDYMRTKSVKELALSALQAQEAAAGEDPSGHLRPDDELVNNALLSEIREKCHYFITFMLTEEQRIPLILRDIFRFSYRETAYLLDLTEDTVRSRLSRARTTLKKHFENRCSWINPDNPCRCESQALYALTKYPSLRKKLEERTARPEYNRMIAEQLSHKITDEKDIMATFPMLDLKGRKNLENILKNT